MNNDEIIQWLLQGDVSLQYQVYRDLLDINRPDLQKRIASEGWGRHFLSQRNENLHWGQDFYQPKWISTHYTLLDLRNLNLHPLHTAVRETINLVLDHSIAHDGGIKLGPSTAQYSDVCVNGMFLNYASYFQSEHNKLFSIVDIILENRMPDGGFNCRTTRSGAVHSSLHTTISVLEGLFEFQKRDSGYRTKDIDLALNTALEFILLHQLYISDKTGQIIHKDFTKTPYPCRWKYDFLRALDYISYARIPYDSRMDKALDLLMSKRHTSGLWKVNAAYPGQVHFTMEEAGKPSRWNTLRALRIIQSFAL